MKANPDNKTFADDEVPDVAVHVPEVPAEKPLLQTVHDVAEVQARQLDPQPPHVGIAVA